MDKNKKNSGVLSDHKKAGKRLIPPLMQLDRIVETSFADDVLPNLVWLSAIFTRTSDRDAVETIIAFINCCHQTLEDEEISPLAFLGNFQKLTDTQRSTLRSEIERLGMLKILQKNLGHQHHLLDRFPLAFLFDERSPDINRAKNIEMIKVDVDKLLNRYTHHATKVQTTVIVSMLTTGRMKISSAIDLPDFNAIFTAPDSDDARRAASWARASLNAGAGFDIERNDKGSWAYDFWQQVFSLADCT